MVLWCSSTLLECVLFQRRYVYFALLCYGRVVKPLTERAPWEYIAFATHRQFLCMKDSIWMPWDCWMPIHSTDTHTLTRRTYSSVSAWLEVKSIIRAKKVNSVISLSVLNKERVKFIYIYALGSVLLWLDHACWLLLLHKQYKFQIKTFLERACIWPCFFLICDAWNVESIQYCDRMHQESIGSCVRWQDLVAIFCRVFFLALFIAYRE